MNDPRDRSPPLTPDGAAPEPAGASSWVLRLYVAGGAPRSAWAIRNVKKLCEEHLPGRFDLEVIDVYQQPALAQHADLLATPTLVKVLPLPLRRFIGTMSDTPCLLAGLDVHRETLEELDEAKKGSR